MKLCVVAPGDCNESMWPAQIVADPDIAGIGVCGYQPIHFVCFYLQDYSVGNYFIRCNLITLCPRCPLLAISPLDCSSAVGR
jgi:hypothetical protein